MQEIKVTLTTNKKEKPDPSTLVFGRTFTDHMFVMDYYEGQGWVDPRIVPYAPLTLDPSCMCLHYGQEVFEGMKAYRHPDGSAHLFRPEKNMARLNASNDRIAIPAIDEELALEALKKLVDIDSDWIPYGEGTSLYIRPFIIAVEPALGVHVANHMMFMIIMCPVGSYFKGGLTPVNIYIEERDVRAVVGGTGAAKTGGNYAASLRAEETAKKQGYSQVLWLDGVERKYIEEVGCMNIFFKIDGEVVTPALYGSVLPGITRMSCLELLRSWGANVSERRISIDELEAAAKAGKLEEAFGTGTAAVISPVGGIKIGDTLYSINGGKIGEISQKLYDTITGIQNGKLEDTFNWTVAVKD